MTCELCALNSDIAFPARSLAKQVVDNILCVSGRDAAAGEEGKQAVCRVAVTGDVVDENRLVGNAEEVLLGLDDKHGIEVRRCFSASESEASVVAISLYCIERPGRSVRTSSESLSLARSVT